jgi:hypothetical protein
MAAMKFCHAAALALVGWYLMVPDPDNDIAGFNYDDCHTAVVARCEIHDTFDTLAACKAALDGALREEMEVEGGTALLFDKAACLASDDPRVKKK